MAMVKVNERMGRCLFISKCYSVVVVVKGIRSGNAYAKLRGFNFLFLDIGILPFLDIGCDFLKW